MIKESVLAQKRLTVVFNLEKNIIFFSGYSSLFKNMLILLNNSNFIMPSFKYCSWFPFQEVRQTHQNRVHLYKPIPSFHIKWSEMPKNAL